MASLFAAIGLYALEFNALVVPYDTLNTWVAITFASWAARILAFVPVFVLPPARVARSLVARSVPLLIVVMAAAYWVWTIDMFVSIRNPLAASFIYLSLIGISVSMAGLWSTTPIAVGIHCLVTWGAFLLKLHLEWTISGWELLVLAIGILTTHGIVHAMVSQTRRDLDQSDEVDLLVSRLEETNEASVSELRQRSAFFDEACHDFKQRLHAMKLMAAVSELPPDSQAAQSVARLIGAAAELERYTKGLLDFAKIQSLEEKPPLLGPTAIQSIFQRVDLHFEPVAKRRDVRLTFRVTDSVVSSNADALERIVENLVSNAIKFTRGGVVVAARRSVAGVSIEVWDQGEGVRPEAKDRLFEAFHQDQQSLHYVGPETGVGLGLAIVKRLCDCLGYRASFRSVVGKGSVFKVLIPESLVIPG